MPKFGDATFKTRGEVRGHTYIHTNYSSTINIDYSSPSTYFYTHTHTHAHTHIYIHFFCYYFWVLLLPHLVMCITHARVWSRDVVDSILYNGLI